MIQDSSLEMSNESKIYALRNPTSLVCKRKFTAIYCIDTISFRGPEILQDLPQGIKNSNLLNLFKTNIKRYETLTCQ